MSRIAATLAILVLGALPAQAWRWPLEETSVEVTFGQGSGGVFHRGVLLRGDGGEVYPVAAGTVTFVADGQAADGQLGVTLVVDHERGFRSVYGHLDPGTVATPGTVVTEETPIGRAGRAGSVSGSSVYLALIDVATGVYVNPQLLLPDLQDDVRPTITAVLAQRGASLFDLGEVSTLPAGAYTIVIECSDRLTAGGPRVAPFSVTVLAGGMQTYSVAHERIIFADGYPRLHPGPGIAYVGSRSGDDGYIAGNVSIPSGRTVIEVVVSDLGGNVASVMVEVTGVP